MREKIFSILNNHSYDADECETSKTEVIEELITNGNWFSILNIFIDILKDENLKEYWQEALYIFWGAACDKRVMPSNFIIALMYYRFESTDDSYVYNLIWSITCKLKNIRYLSDYDPLQDPDILIQVDLSTFQ